MGAGLPDDPVLSPRDFERVCDFLYRETGIVLRAGKEVMVQARLGRRLRELSCRAYADYLQRLLAPGAETEVRIAVDLLTTNETFFFREPRHFEVLRDLAARRSPSAGPFNVWSAACSSGEEPWSIAMTLEDTLGAGRWSVFCTDISTRVLVHARRAIYGAHAVRHLPAAMLRRFCLRGTGEYEGHILIRPELRTAVTFRHANLLRPPTDVGFFDLVFLRNVMIYLDQPTKQAVVRHLVDRIAPGGHLIVGQTESVSGFDPRLRLVEHSVYQVATRPAAPTGT